MKVLTEEPDVYKRQVMDAAREFFEAGPTAWANFHTFRRNVSAVRLYYREEAEAETEE